MEDTTLSSNKAPYPEVSAESLSASPGGDARELLGHLLKIEAEAAALADEAQAEADRRVSEGEKQNRSRYEEQYSRETTALEAAYVREIEGAKEVYKKELETYRDSLNNIMADTGAFSALMTELVKGK
jgi:regulator of protease activity HflC (stomatin/prohibitin superfamily)